MLHWYWLASFVYYKINCFVFVSTLFYFFRTFPTSVSWWLFNGDLKDSKSLQISWTVLFILRNALDERASICPPIFAFFSPLTKPLRTVPSVPIGIYVTFMFHNIFSSLLRSKQLLLLLLFTPWEFFTSALADGLSLEFELQQVSKTFLCISPISTMLSYG